MRRITITLFLILFVFVTWAQELECKVSVTAPKMEGSDRRVYESIQKALYEFMNNRKWTNYSFKNEERLDCTMLLTITDRLGSDEFRATLNVVLRRPVFNSAYNSPVLNYIDKEVQFRYVEFQPMDYNDGSFTSNLTSVFAFYAYMVLGFNFDTFTPNGGRPFFDLAQNVVTAAQNAAEPGWKGYDSQRNRFWFAENMTNPSNGSLHEFLYKFHRLGLDQLYDKPDPGRNSITESMDLLKSMYDAKPDLYMLVIILDAKRDEFVNIYSDQKVAPMEKTKVVNILKEIDPANSSKYQAILTK